MTTLQSIRDLITCVNRYVKPGEIISKDQAAEMLEKISAVEMQFEIREAGTGRKAHSAYLLHHTS